ncbi:MAG: 7-cyano-7-deazaguanine synthase QueC [Phycisphaerae bacterium]
MSVRPVRGAVVLLSGGLDSATTLAIALREQAAVAALSFRYGQRHFVEIDAASAVARRLGVRDHVVVEIDLRVFGGSALTADIAVPKDCDPQRGDEIPITYVPARNTIFLAYALALAEVRAATDVYIGVNAVDYSGYPDCRPEYVAAFERVAGLATRAAVEGGPVRIRAPLIAMSKAEIIRRGLELGVPYELTRSCYDPNAAGEACGHCDSCQLRRAGFAAAGVRDPAPYASS